MVVGNLDVEGVSILPAEADAVLVVDSDAVLPFSVALQGFELVAGNRGQIAQRGCAVQMEQLADRDLLDCVKLSRELLLEDLFRCNVSKRTNHVLIVYRYGMNVKEEATLPYFAAKWDQPA
jgi:hypothetical protein